MKLCVMICFLSFNIVHGNRKNNRNKTITLSSFLDLYSNEVNKSHEVHPYIRFDEDYNTKKMPLNNKDPLPLEVNLTINIKNIYGADEVNQLLGLETTVQMNWIDERITLLDVSKEHINQDRITLPSEVYLLMYQYSVIFRFGC